MNELRCKVEFVLPASEIGRVSYRPGDEGVEIVLDLHGLTCREARRIIVNLVNILRQRVWIVLIHGYRHGTAIKDMLPTIRNEHIAMMQPDPHNQGRTHLLTA